MRHALLPAGSRTLLAALASLAILLTGPAPAAQADDSTEQGATEHPGISKTKPTSGRFVKVGDHYMVPYTVKIPGTEAEYSMVPIPGGKFTIGSPADETKRSDDEGPQRTIEIEPFWMGQYEVTWSEYKEYMKLYELFKSFEASGIRPITTENEIDAITAPTQLYDPSYTFGLGEKPQQPAVTMSQYAAKQYTQWISGVTGRQYRLPSEAEWEYACRAGTTTAYHFGDDPAQLGDYAWYYENSDGRPQLVGKKKPNPWGLYDMHGNACEWTLDQYFENGYERLADEPHQAADVLARPDVFYPRVLRGGSWDDEADRCRAAAKLASSDEDWKEEDPNLPLSPWWFTNEPARTVGFRIVRPLKTLPKEEMAKYWVPTVDEVVDDVQLRLDGGRGVRGLVDEDLPAAIKKLKSGK